jgi:hypothetical protein
MSELNSSLPCEMSNENDFLKSSKKHIVLKEKRNSKVHHIPHKIQAHRNSTRISEKKIAKKREQKKVDVCEKKIVNSTGTKKVQDKKTKLKKVSFQLQKSLVIKH